MNVLGLFRGHDLLVCLIGRLNPHNMYICIVIIVLLMLDVDRHAFSVST